MSKDKDHWFKFKSETWLADPMVCMLSIEARGVLIELMALAHRGTPIGYVNTCNGRRPLSAKVISATRNIPIETLEPALEELLDYERIVHDEEKGYSIPKMVKDAEYAAKQSEHGRRGGGNPALSKLDKDNAAKTVTSRSKYTDAFLHCLEHSSFPFTYDMYLTAHRNAGANPDAVKENLAVILSAAPELRVKRYGPMKVIMWEIEDMLKGNGNEDKSDQDKDGKSPLDKALE